MFKEEETQYCPMCVEWTEKYEKPEKKLKMVRRLVVKAIDPEETNDMKSMDCLYEALKELEQ